MSEFKELVITSDDYRLFLADRLRMDDKRLAQEVEKVGFPFLFASGSELLRSYILNETGFLSQLPERLRLPDRGYAWYMFSQSVKEIHVESEKAVIKYELHDDYRLPFKRFYI